MELKWIDRTTYSRGVKIEDRKINSIATKVNNMEIMIHKHIYYNEKWIITCYELGIEKYDLKTENIEDAKYLGLKYIKNILEEEIDRYKNIVLNIGEDNG